MHNDPVRGGRVFLYGPILLVLGDIIMDPLLLNLYGPIFTTVCKVYGPIFKAYEPIFTCIKA